ncbi:hypothetical protein QJS10_CPB17g00855 [Acorus calamus]|uniref:Uncharacterized protein n=1 Tax=Acorus calamus TaxID=4465 RepID=A0AAV9CVE7_ACOCL|nr:hypothetical protein QJS10_CPB17g00855 [Acorus calamus]
MPPDSDPSPTPSLVPHRNRSIAILRRRHRFTVFDPPPMLSDLRFSADDIASPSSTPHRRCRTAILRRQHRFIISIDSVELRSTADVRCFVVSDPPLILSDFESPAKSKGF